MRIANMDHLASSNREFAVLERVIDACFIWGFLYVSRNVKVLKLKVY